ncbi:hypothetical protein BDZ89DRAFT_1132658 [Hymenopellis radicata]|nr:hypothetical protein BDZ89DRAFT_1132658 [Hymenopellis radicata]
MPHDNGGCSKLQQTAKTTSQLVKKYKSFVQPLSTDEIESLYQDAINLPTDQQDVIPEALRAILVFHAIPTVPSRTLGRRGKVNGVDIADWDIRPLPFDHACATCTDRSIPCHFKRRKQKGRKKCRECQLLDKVCRPGGLGSSSSRAIEAPPSTSGARSASRHRANGSDPGDRRSSKRPRTVGYTPSTSFVMDPFAHLSKETLLEVVKDLQAKVNETNTEESELEGLAKDKEILVLKKEMSRMKKDFKVVFDNALSTADGLKKNASWHPPPSIAIIDPSQSMGPQRFSIALPPPASTSHVPPIPSGGHHASPSGAPSQPGMHYAVAPAPPSQGVYYPPPPPGFYPPPQHFYHVPPANLPPQLFADHNSSEPSTSRRGRSGSRLAAKPVGLVLNALRLEQLPTKIVGHLYFQTQAGLPPMNMLIHSPL